MLVHSDLLKFDYQTSLKISQIRGSGLNRGHAYLGNRFKMNVIFPAAKKKKIQFNISSLKQMKQLKRSATHKNCVSEIVKTEAIKK